MEQINHLLLSKNHSLITFALNVIKEKYPSSIYFDLNINELEKAYLEIKDRNLHIDCLKYTSSENINSLLYFKDLKILTLQSVNNKSFDLERICNLTPNIEILTSNQLNLKSIPNNISSLKNLELLNMYNNGIKEIPLDLFKLTNLKNLYLPENKIKFIPKEISNLIQLEELELYDNNISTIPKELYNLINLTYLELSENKISYISKDIKNLIHLSEVSLRVNKIKRVPKELFEINSLKVLDLSDNLITKISITKGVYNLRYLNLSNNPIEITKKELYELGISKNCYIDL